MDSNVEIENNPEGGFIVKIDGEVVGKVFMRNETDWVAREAEDEHVSTDNKSAEDAIQRLIDFNKGIDHFSSL